MFSYIPLSVGYDELYNLMSYFLPLPDEDVVDSSSGLHRRTRSAGEKMKRWWNRLRGKGDGTGGGNEELRKVAEDGLKWSETVGNKPDIEAYVLRLALGSSASFLCLDREFAFFFKKKKGG